MDYMHYHSFFRWGSSIFPVTLFLILVFVIWFSFQNQKNNEIIASLLYGGASLILTKVTNSLVVFCFIEVMMVSGAYLIFSGNSKSSYAAGLRYLKMHIIAGVFILLGIIDYYETFNDFHFRGDIFEKVNLYDVTTYKHGFLILGLLINSAIFPLSAWLPDSYPKASHAGSLTLAVFLTKISIFLLAKIYWGIGIFIPIGVITALYAAFYMIIENNLKRFSAYFLVMQNGILLAAIGIGGDELKAYFPLILSLSAIYSFLSMYIASHAAVQGLECFSELSAQKKLQSNIWALLLGFTLIIGLPFSVSYISKKLISIHSSTTYFLIILDYSIIPLTMATYGKLMSYINIKNLPRIKPSIVQNREYYFVLAVVFLIGIIAHIILGVLPSLEEFVAKLMYFFIALLISKWLFKFIKYHKYASIPDIDWIYRVCLFNLYKACAYPIYRAIRWLTDNIQAIIEKFHSTNLLLLSEQGLVSKAGSLYRVLLSFLLFILLVYYLLS